MFLNFSFLISFAVLSKTFANKGKSSEFFISNLQTLQSNICLHIVISLHPAFLSEYDRGHLKFVR